ncbi:ParB N-terminal domain-containing protein [Rhodococcoides corynebacterioides]|uniref:ParB N-terminal domain-containing protein n=1 Tax=Rhodococcoides corynebacterioides TaxID=53972 RepID=UPI001C9A70C9|nr:ParB N-terminal domain-containing protein [Rhodococcus corynebacterioides]MBY6350815.1 ParB N-terminal domain-containing protein [Rhodococcus corynebacterioides]
MTVEGPTNRDEVSKVVAERLEASAHDNGPKETVTIEWRGAKKYLPVISMPIDLLTYNPGTHRIRAQRELDTQRDAELTSDPFGASAQAYLHTLLMGDPKDPSSTDPSFTALMADIKQHGQTDAGIITRHGVLINGNTRRAALKELGQRDIRVAVLPPDASHEDTRSVELALQLRKDHRRDYSFVNFLIALDDRVNDGMQAKQIQKEFRIAATTYDRNRWILQAMREMIERSEVTDSNGKKYVMRLMDFEDHQGKLEELYRAYINLKSKNSDQAEALREQRLLALLLNKSKTDLRLIEPDFSDKYMKDLLTDSDKQGVSDPISIPGTKIRAQGPSPRVQALRKATDRALRAKAIKVVEGDAAPTLVKQAGETLEDLDKSMENALDVAGRHGRVTKRRHAPAERLSDANDDLVLAVTAVAEARATSNLDPDDLEEAVSSVRASLTKLAQLLDPSSEAQNPGLMWLRAAAQISDTQEP